MTEQELHRKYHEVASIFPLMAGEEFKASAKTDKYIVSISPSVHSGHFYISCVELQGLTCEYLSKPIKLEYIEEALVVMGIDTNRMEWSIRKCQPLASPPFASTAREKPKPLVYFIEGAGKIKIGVAQFPESRLETLQANSPVTLRMLATYKGGYELENKLHRRFAHLRQHGEWFNAGQELLDYMEELRC